MCRHHSTNRALAAGQLNQLFRIHRRNLKVVTADVRGDVAVDHTVDRHHIDPLIQGALADIRQCLRGQRRNQDQVAAGRNQIFHVLHLLHLGVICIREDDLCIRPVFLGPVDVAVGHAHAPAMLHRALRETDLKLFPRRLRLRRLVRGFRSVGRCRICAGVTALGLAGWGRRVSFRAACEYARTAPPEQEAMREAFS